jgi:hypothetical protein
VGGAISKELIAESISRRPILILGDVGAGKSTFLRHLLKINAAEQFQNAISIHIDLGKKGTLASDLNVFVLQEVEYQLRNKWDIDIDSDGLVRAAYRAELQRFASGIYSRIRESDPSEYLSKEISFLDNKIQNRASHLKQVLEHVAKGRRKQVVIFLDNADQRDFETQQKAFLIAQEISSEWPALVFLALRPETFHQSLRAEGVLSGYHPKAFTIAPPRIDKVVQKRLAFATKITSGQIDVPSIDNTTFDFASLEAVMGALAMTFHSRCDTAEMIDNIASGNVRLALDIVRGFIGSGHVNTSKIVKIMSEEGRYFVPLHEFVRAVAFGDYLFYDPSRSYLANIFDVNSDDPKEHFLLPVLLAELSSWRGGGAQEGFVETSKIYARLQDCGYTPDQIDLAFVRSHRYRLLEATARRTPKVGLEMPPSFRVTSVGIYHSMRLSKIFSYVDAVIIDTPVLDQGVREKISNVFGLSDRVHRVEIFLSYLDEAWQGLSGCDLIFPWKDQLSALESEISRIKHVVGSHKVREHH